MKKLWAILVLLLALNASALSLSRWKSTSSTDMNNSANYNAASLTTGDSIVYSDSAGITEVTPAATAALSVGYINQLSSCPYNFTLTGYGATAVSGISLNVGTLSCGYFLKLTGSGQMHLNSAGTLTLSSDTLGFYGTTDTLDIDKNNAAATTLCRLAIGPNTLLLNTSGADMVAFLTTNAAVIPLIVRSGSSFNSNTGATKLTAFICGATGTTACSLAVGATLTGNTAWYFGPSANNVKMTIPAMAIGGTGSISFLPYGNPPHDDTTIFSGAVDYGAMPVIFSNTAKTGINILYSNPSNNFTCGTINFGTANASARHKYKWGTGTYSVDSVVISSVGTDSVYMPNVMNVTGSWLDAAPSANDLRSVGTSIVNFISNKKALLQTKNHTVHYYDVNFRAADSWTDSLDDSLTGHTVTIDSCKKLTFGGKNMYLTGDFIARGRAADTVTSCMTPNRLTFYNAATLQVLTQQTATDSLTVYAKKSLYFSIDKGVKIRELTTDAGAKVTISAGQTLTLDKNSVRQQTGTTATPDSVISSSAGNVATVALSAIREDTAFYAKDIAATGFLWYDTIRGTNGGGTSGFVFASAHGNYTSGASSTPTFTGLSRTSVPAAGGGNDTITGTNFYGGDSVSLDSGTTWIACTWRSATSIYFAVPAHAAGVLKPRLKNIDYQTANFTGTLTYVAAPLLSYRTSPLSATVGVAITPDTCLSTGGATDSLVFRHGLAVGGLSYSKVTGIISGVPTTVQTVTDTLDGFQFGAVAASVAVAVVVTSSGGTAPKRHRGMGLGIGLSYADEPRGAFMGAAWR